MTDTDVRATANSCACCRLCHLSDRVSVGQVELAEDGVTAPVADRDDPLHAEDRHGGHTMEDPDQHAGHGPDHTGHEETFRKRFWISSALSIPVLYWSGTIQDWFGYTALEFTGSFLIVPVLATFIFVYGGYPFLSMSGFELKLRRPGMMTLISLAISVAYWFSMLTIFIPSTGDDFFWELVTLIDIMLLGHWMEMRSVRQASGSLGALAKLVPDTADIDGPDGVVTTIPLSELRTEQIMLIRPGASAPADGVVTEGESDFDEALITGESRPVKKQINETIIGGTVNSGSGAIRAQVTATGDATALSGIMLLVAKAEASKSPTQLLADRAASVLFYVAIGAAALTAVVWTLVYGGFDERTIARVVTVLVIACPHALGLAIPLVVSNTTGIAADNGILIRKREAIDTARNLDVIVFDKTGTLTTGQMGVTEIATIEGVSREMALELAAAVEGDSEHPMARAIRESAASREISVPVASSFEALKGRGVRATINGTDISVGGPRLLESMNAAVPGSLAALADAAGLRGVSVVYVIEAGSPIAAIAISDVVRSESNEAIKALKHRGVSVGMMTGDSDDVAQAVADELDLDFVLSQVLPADKDAHISQLQENGDDVGMVGDGVNDAPALVRADIGIAIGSGTDVAVQSADLVLVSDDPRGVVKILRLSAASYRKQLENIWWGAGYNIVMIPLAAGILVPLGFDMPPSVGAALMSLSTIIVAVNAQLLRRLNLNVD